MAGTSWIKVGQEWPLRTVCFVIDARAFVMRGDISQLLDPESPAAIEKAIEAWRPDLAGVQVLGIGFNALYRRMEIIATHRKFEPVPFGDECPMIAIEVESVDSLGLREVAS